MIIINSLHIHLIIYTRMLAFSPRFVNRKKKKQTAITARRQ